MKNIFELRSLKYKDILDIDYLNIPANKITAIIGESGSGKTTLLRLFNNLNKADSGNLFFCDQDIYSLDPVRLRRRVVMLGQEPVVFPGTVRDNLNTALRFADKKTINDEKLKEYIKMVHLNKSLDDSVARFSGGEKQRVALARVLIIEPHVLLLDEPSSALDEETEQLVIQTIVDYVKKHNKTLIMVTHSKKIAMDYGDNIVRIKKGKVVKGDDI